MTIIDKNEDKTFNPSLDIKDSMLVLGFRIKNEKKETDIFIIKTNDGIFHTEDLCFDFNEQYFSIEKKNRVLSKMSQKWSSAQVNTFLESVIDPLSKSISEINLYNKIKNSLKEYIELEEEADYIILTAWVIGTYFFPIFSAYPYIHIKAPKGSGKSQCLNFLNQTCFNAVKARASLPALRDTVDSLRGTYLMDQADALHRNNMEDFLDILTDSYKRGGGSIRKMIANKKGWDMEEFEAYSPKAFASIRELPEDLRDRCIVIPLIRSNKNYPQINEESNIWREIRSELYVLLISQFVFFEGNYKLKNLNYKESNEIFGRKLELWLPIETTLKSMFVNNEEIESAKKRFLSRYEFASYQTSEIEVAILETIINLLNDKQEIILRPKEIATEIDTELFDEDDKFVFASQKQKATIVGRAINKFNLATQKLARDSYGERYLFTKEHLDKIYQGYFNQKKEDSDTPTCTNENYIEDADLFNELSSVA